MSEKSSKIKKVPQKVMVWAVWKENILTNQLLTWDEKRFPRKYQILCKAKSLANSFFKTAPNQLFRLCSGDQQVDFGLQRWSSDFAQMGPTDEDRCKGGHISFHVTNNNDNNDSENHSARFKTAADLDLPGVFWAQKPLGMMFLMGLKPGTWWNSEVMVPKSYQMQHSVEG